MIKVGRVENAPSLNDDEFTEFMANFALKVYGHVRHDIKGR